MLFKNRNQYFINNRWCDSWCYSTYFVWMRGLLHLLIIERRQKEWRNKTKSCIKIRISISTDFSIISIVAYKQFKSSNGINEISEKDWWTSSTNSTRLNLTSFLIINIVFLKTERSCYAVLIFASLLDISLKHKMKQHRYKFIEKIWHKKERE